MKVSFIEDVVDAIGSPEEWSDTTVIFPNRRAGLFFRQALLEKTEGKTVFAPEIYSLEDFIFSSIPYRQADPLTLSGLLYKSYKKVFPNPDTFAEFFFWGKMILRDFDDIDQHVADARTVYSIVEKQKQLDLGLGFLTPEQIKILSSFWRKFTDDPTAHKDHFISVWKRLYPLYQDFQKLMASEGLVYKGFAYKLFLENPERYLAINPQRRFFFAGFNALTRSENEIISYFLKEKSTSIIWDVDEYYIKDNAQEAGRYMRDFLHHRTFKYTFPETLPKRISAREEPVEIIGVPFRAGQAKYVGQELRKLLDENPDLPLEKIAIVLPDEQLLFAVLNALPPAIDKFNVTMGFPVEVTPLFSLLLHCLTLQDHIKPGTKKLYFRPAVKILQHPIIEQVTGNASDGFVKNLLKLNKVYINVDELNDIHPIFPVIFQHSGNNYTDYLLKVLENIADIASMLNPESATALNFIIKQLFELQRFEKELQMKHELRNYSRFLRLLMSSDKIPFEGEPLRGLQVMGVLETRNLDFEYVFVLSLNEEFFPADSRQKSFIPYNIRKAFDLPVFDQQDAIYAYLFYRLFQRSRKVTLLYNTEGNVFGGQEMSRFLQQLLIENPFPLSHKLLNTPVQPKPPEPIIIEKDDRIMAILMQYTFQGGDEPKRWLYPSTSFSYLYCRLQFYFRYIARIREAAEIDDEVDARLFGNILHECMEQLYSILKEKNGSIIASKNIKELRKLVPGLVEKNFRIQFGNEEDKKFDFSGQNIIQREILIKFINRILDYDASLGTMEILALETDNADGYEVVFTLDGSSGLQIGLKGKIDRLDILNGNIRVIDYKTGGDKVMFKSLDELFERDGKHVNKAAFQTLFYSLLYVNKHSTYGVVTPGLYSRTNLFMEPYDFRLQMKGENKFYSPVDNYHTVKVDYENHIKNLLVELFNKDIPFDQTTELSRCEYCPYKGICRR